MTVKDEEMEELFRLADGDDVWRSYLLDKLTKIDNPSKWLSKLKQKGYFNPKDNPKPSLDKEGHLAEPYWEPMGYLARISELNKDNPRKEITGFLIEILDSIIGYKEDGRRIENAKTDWVIVKIIFNLPISEIKPNHIDFIKTALRTKRNPIVISNEISEKAFPYLIEKRSKELLLNLLSIVFEFEINEQSYFNKFNSIIGDYYLNQIVSKHQKDLIEICGSGLYDILIEKIRKIIEIDKRSFSSIITIEDSSQNLRDNYQTILINLFRDTLINQPLETIKNELSVFLNEDNQMFRRLAIYVIDYYYDEVNQLFWSIQKNPLEDFMLKHELYELFKKHSKDFSEKQLLRVLNWIETEDLDALENFYKNKAELRIATARHRKEWLTSLVDTQHSEVKNLYNRYNKIFPSEIEHPGYIIWSSGVVVSPLSTRSLDESFEGKSNEEIAIYLKSSKDEPKKWEESLSSSFEKYVAKNSGKISESLAPFLDLSYELQYSLLAGMYDAWQSKEEVEWCEVLNFCFAIIDTNTFWETKDEHKDWIVKKIAELIERGIRDDSHAFDEKYMPLAEKILITLALRDSSTLPSIRDLFTSVLNSTKGSIYSAMILYSLRYAKIRKEKIWKETIKEYFNDCINHQAPIELYVIIGQYLLNIAFLDKDWLKSNMDKIFPKDNQEYWKATITGYFYGSNKLSAEIYKLLKESSNYEKALITEFEDKFLTRRLVEHICIAYLNDLEDLSQENSLIYRIIEKCEPKIISELVSFVWRLREKTSKSQKEKIIILLEKLVENVLVKENEPEFSSILSNLSHWITTIDELDSRTANLLKVSARHAGPDYSIILLIDNLLKFVEKNPKEVGEILNEAVTKNTFPIYKIENIQKIVTTLYEKQEKNIANEICKKFWNNKQFFLKDIYDKYNKE